MSSNPDDETLANVAQMSLANHPVFPNEVLGLVAAAVDERDALLVLRVCSIALRELSDRHLYREIYFKYPFTSAAKITGVQAPHIAQWARSISFRTECEEYPAGGKDPRSLFQDH